MATNEIHREGFWLSVPVPDDAVSGDPFVWGTFPCVIQNLFQEELPEIEGYVARPRVPNGNTDASTSDVPIPADTVYGSVAFVGVWAFDLGITAPGDVTVGDPVYYTAATNSLSLAGPGDGIYGYVLNVGFDLNVHVRLAPILAS